jgi:outer membrane protein assembly factor BamB
VWSVVGDVGGTPGLDIINSTPWIDYAHNAIWVTSRSAGSSTQPSLWKLDPNTGAILATLNLGDIDSSPTMTPQAEVLFVGKNDGTLYAIDPLNAQVLASYQSADGPVRGYPLVANFTSPFQIVISGSSKVQMVTFDLRTRTFTPNWRTNIVQPSAPLGFADIGRIYVGAGDGKLHELVLATGDDTKQRVVNPVQSVIVGDPSLDVMLSRIYVSASDGRVYAFSYPF